MNKNLSSTKCTKRRISCCEGRRELVRTRRDSALFYSPDFTCFFFKNGVPRSIFLVIRFFPIWIKRLVGCQFKPSKRRKSSAFVCRMVLLHNIYTEKVVPNFLIPSYYSAYQTYLTHNVVSNIQYKFHTISVLN